MATSTSMQEVDKKLAFGKFQDAEDRKARLRERIAHKAADMALEDDPLQVINTKTGISTPGAVGIAGILGASLLGYGWLNRDTPATPSVNQPAASEVSDSEYEVRFFQRGADGVVRPIDVNRLPEELRGAVK